ncbi:aldo/keto reductase [Micromonospora sp. KC207]|uniref:aldo/keto reductase n=1 Tax=Micromonospora sp. KC207 TaxID=2530377 RepID=UPI001404574F|nr:aldo/keto reductase [Micromonospora sp. KC207]
MEYRQLGRCGLRVSKVSLGAFNFGGPTGPEEAARIVATAVEAGVNLVDTANVYQDGRSEEIVGAAVRSCRDDVLLATKIFNPVGPGPNDRGTSAYALKRECERSLRRLSTDHIDLLYLHRHDPDTPVEETVSALDDLVRSGKVRYVGTSTVPTAYELADQPRLGTVPSWRIVDLLRTAQSRGAAPVVAEQSPYNLLEREIERDVLPLCAEYGLGLFTYSPLAMGLLSDRFADGEPPRDARFTAWYAPSGPHWQPVWRTLGRLAKVAVELGLSLPDLAHAWVYDAPGVTSTVVGPRTLDQARAALAAADRPLPDEARARLDGIAAPGESRWLRVVERGVRRSRGGPDDAEENVSP